MLVKSENVPKCGQFGFRCTDSSTFEICSEPDSDGNTDPPIMRQCPLETRCNEDESTYCSPIEVEPQRIGRSLKRKEHIKVEKQFKDGAECNLREEIEFGVFNDDYDEDNGQGTSTEPSDILDYNEVLYTEPPPMNCEREGFYPGM